MIENYIIADKSIGLGAYQIKWKRVVRASAANTMPEIHNRVVWDCISICLGENTIGSQFQLN
jgi:hypothetical protein